MSAALKSQVPAPSSTLLRFLRSQSDSLYFFSSNPSVDCSRFRFRFSKHLLQSDNLNRNLPHAKIARGCYLEPAESSILNINFLKPSTRQKRCGRLISTRELSKTAQEARSIRHASTDNHNLLKKLWIKNRKDPTALKAEDLPLPSFLDDTGGTSLARSKAGKSANELKLRCTEINENGDVTLVNGEFKKSELIAKVSLGRDNPYSSRKF